jgi:signal transduction histidine kinase
MTKAPSHATRILVVDDNPAVLKLLGSLFEEHGTTVFLARDVPQAKAALDEHRWQIDLVLSDISMPGESGFDLLSWIKREDSPNRDLPVLLTTAQLPEAENRVKGLAMGAVDYVVRPIELSELVLRASHAVEHFKRIRTLESSLQNSENLAIVGRLLAASHHEIKNLASLVNLAADQAVKCFTASADARGAEVLRSLAQSAELLTDISRNVTGLLEPGATVSRPVDLTALVADVADLMRARVKPCHLEVATATGPRWVLGHAVRIKQIVINLILNAYDAIATSDAPQTGLIRIEVVPAAERVVRIEVIDDGIGFSPAGERREFKPFATTKKLSGGQGLGLWLCATLAHHMKGSLTLRSRGVGEGATASLSLPATEAPGPDEFEVERYLAELEGT